MTKHVAGSSYSEIEIPFKTLKQRLKTDSVEIRGDTMVIGSDVSEPEGHYCIEQRIELDKPRSSLIFDAHFDWHLPAGANVEPFSGAKLNVFRRRRDRLTFLGEGHVCMVGYGGDDAKMQVSLNALNRELANDLTGCQESPIDGEQLQKALGRKNCDRMALAEEMATSWLGKLPRSKDPLPDCRDRPADVKKWHRLWSQLEKFHQFPWCCWPATWNEPDEHDVRYFQNEWQNGGTFGHRDDGIWIHEWACTSEMTLAAKDMAEFAIQFLITGLIQGADGRFVYSKESPDWVQPLPITPWADYFGDRMTFVGGKGAVGATTEYGTSLAVSKERFDDLLGDAGKSL